MANFTVCVQEKDFDVALLQRELVGDELGAGAVAAFTGYVRCDNPDTLLALELEHYSGMTQKCIQGILVEASERWPLFAASVVHRVGKLAPGAQIVWVGVSAAHRPAAFDACEFVMDYLKVEAPFWKKEWRNSGSYWLDPMQSDTARAQEWNTGSD